MKAKRIDYKNYIERECEGYTSYDKPEIIFEGTRGIVITDWEFIHTKDDLITDSHRVNVCKIPEPNCFAMMPDGYVTEQISVLMEECDVEEIDVSDYFRNPNYNSRLGSNFSGLCKSLMEIGFDGEFTKELAQCLSERNQG